MTKACTKCGQIKSLDAFNKKKRGKHGVNAQCKACKKAYLKAYEQTPGGMARKKARKKTHRQRGHDFVNQYANDTGNDRCVKCGSTENLEWDHIDPATKVFNIADSYLRSTEAIEAELKKCQRLCQSCHIDKGDHGCQKNLP